MSEEMQQDAVDCATQALEKYNIEKDIAAYIKKEFDKSTTPPGTASLAATSARTSPTRPGTSSTSTWARSPYCCSSRARPSPHPTPPHRACLRQRHGSSLAWPEAVYRQLSNLASWSHGGLATSPPWPHISLAIPAFSPEASQQPGGVWA